MPTDEEQLRTLNLAISQAESAGDRNFLAGVLAPELAFLRANGSVDDAGRYLQKVAKGAERPTQIDSVEVLGNRAIVKCVVTMAGKRYHNIRLFVRIAEDWQLLAWANEEIQPL